MLKVLQGGSTLFLGGGAGSFKKNAFFTFPWFKHILSKHWLKTREMLKMLEFFGPTDKNVPKTGEMLKMLKVLQGIPLPFLKGGGSIPQKTFNIFEHFPNFKHFLWIFWKF